MKRCRAGSARTARTSVLLRMCSSLTVLLVFDGDNLTIIMCCPNTLQSWQWGLCIDLCLLHIWNGCRVGPKRTARTFTLLEFECAIGI